MEPVHVSTKPTVPSLEHFVWLDQVEQLKRMEMKMDNHKCISRDTNDSIARFLNLIQDLTASNKVLAMTVRRQQDELSVLRHFNTNDEIMLREMSLKIGSLEEENGALKEKAPQPEKTEPQTEQAETWTESVGKGCFQGPEDQTL